VPSFLSSSCRFPSKPERKSSSNSRKHFSSVREVEYSSYISGNS
jgi:hypothetical protein